MLDFDHEFSRIDGLYVGQLSDSEMKLFAEAVKENRAYREYAGGSGFMGLAKVRVIKNQRSY